MTKPSVRHRHLGLALIGAVAAAMFGAAPASAIDCPPGAYTGNPLLDYCQLVHVPFATLIAGDAPEAWFRLGDVQGSETITDSSGHAYNGGFKNGQDSGPIGISGDGDTARDFWGQSGYAYINDIPAPGQENGYLNYTMEAFFRLEDTDGDVAIHNDGTIMQFGGGGAIYVQSNTLRFRNGPDDEVLVPNLFQDNKWYMVVARKSGTNLSVWFRASPDKNTPTAFPPTPDATGFSHYLPGGSPTFYIGYGSWADWFNGQIDEVSYFRYALSPTQIALHFYADPAPDNALTRRIPSATPAGNAPGTHSDNSSNPATKPSTSKAAKLKKAKADVKRITGLVTKAQRWVGSLKHHHASKKTIAAAQKKLTSLRKQLKRAKLHVKSLS